MTRPTIREWARIQLEIGSTAWKWCGQIKSTTFLPSNLKVGEAPFRDCEYLEFGQSLQKIWYSWLDQLSANTNPKHLHMRSVVTKLSFNWPSNWSNSTCWWCHKVDSLVATGLFQADHNKHTNIDLCASAVAFSRSDVIFFLFFAQTNELTCLRSAKEEEMHSRTKLSCFCKNLSLFNTALPCYVWHKAKRRRRLLIFNSSFSTNSSRQYVTNNTFNNQALNIKCSHRKGKMGIFGRLELGKAIKRGFFLAPQRFTCVQLWVSRLSHGDILERIGWAIPAHSAWNEGQWGLKLLIINIQSCTETKLTATKPGRDLGVLKRNLYTSI